MPVSFAGPECESEGLKSPCAGDERHPQNYPQVTLVARAPSACAEDTTNGGETNSHHPAARKRGAGTKEIGLMPDGRGTARGEGRKDSRSSLPPHQLRLGLASLAKPPHPLPMGEGAPLKRSGETGGVPGATDLTEMFEG
jgi:hypothetical protein